MASKQSIRPQLSITTENSSELEQFQNEVIRPIVKLQHHLLIAIMQHKINSLQIDFQALSKEKQRLTIENLFLKDLNFKATIIGTVIGLFEIDELKNYLNHQKDYNKRIMQIVQKRVNENRDQF